MGIWDVCRLLARRWPVSVPLFLLTGGAALVASFNVRPDYVGTAYVSLLQPAVQRGPAAGQSIPANPWDTQTLAGAVVIRLNSKSVADGIESEGYERAWRAALDDKARSIVRIEVTSPTEAQARSTLARLLREANDEVNRQQAAYPGLRPEDRITTNRLDVVDEVETDTGNVTRASVVAAVIGLLVTTAAAAGLDALLRRHSRRRSGAAAQVPPAAPPRPVGQTLAPAGTTIDTDATQPVVITNVPLPMPVANVVPAHHPAAPAASSQDEATIVLPLSNVPWADPPRGITGSHRAADKNSETAGIG